MCAVPRCVTDADGAADRAAAADVALTAAALGGDSGGGGSSGGGGIGERVVDAARECVSL